MNLPNAATDMDWQLVNCIGYLHAGDSLKKEDVTALQLMLQDSIKKKYGITKDFTNLITSSLKQESTDRVEEYKPVLNIHEDSKASNSDDELELDLLKEDLMCVVCNGMDVAAGNQLIECSDCHALYHQDCHRPVVSSQDSFDSWVCSTCKDLVVKSKLYTSASNNTMSSTSQSIPSVSSSNLKLTISKTSRHGSSGSSSSDKYSKGGSSSSKSSSSSMIRSQGSSSSSSSSRNVTPNINIISADKRLQNMKKKAAKLQEKKKHQK